MNKDSGANSNFLFILGAPRSGTSLLMRMLLVKQPDVSGADAESQVYALDHQKKYSVESALRHPYFIKLLSRETLEQFASSSDSFVSLLKKASKRVLEDSGNEIFIEKSPIHTLFADLLHRDFNSPRFLLVEREPGAVIHSMVQTKWIPIPIKRFKDFTVLRLIPYFSATLLYYNYHLAINRFKSQYSHSCIRYEEIVGMSPNELKEHLSRLIGIELRPLFIERPFSPEAASMERKIHQDRIDAFRSRTPRLILNLQAALFDSTPLSNDKKFWKWLMNTLLKFKRTNGGI
jgi:hypothetical protein